MKKGTIEALKSLKLGEKLSSHKPISENEKDLSNTLYKLKNLEILSLNKNSYSVMNFKLLSKFIELQDFEKLVEYIEKEHSPPNITYNYNNVAQLNQSSGKIDLKSPIEQNINNQSPNNPIKISKLQILYWAVGILVSLTILYKFILEDIIKELIK